MFVEVLGFVWDIIVVQPKVILHCFLTLLNFILSINGDTEKMVVVLDSRKEEKLLLLHTVTHV